MEVDIHKEAASLKVTFTINEQADVSRAIELLSKLTQANIEFSENRVSNQLSITYEEVGNYHH